MALDEPVKAIVDKMRLNSSLTALVPKSKIHASFPTDAADKPGIYVGRGYNHIEQILSSGNQGSQIFWGRAVWYVEAYSDISMENADIISKRACEACLPSIPDAGIFNISIQLETEVYNTDYMAYQITRSLICPSFEYVTGG